MLLLVVAFAIIWVAAMMSGVAKTIRRRHEARQRSKQLQPPAGRDDSDAADRAGWPSLLHTGAAADGVASPRALLSPSARVNRVMSTPHVDFDHAGDSAFTTPLAGGDDDSEQRVPGGVGSSGAAVTVGNVEVETKRDVAGAAVDSDDPAGSGAGGWTVNPMRSMRQLAPPQRVVHTDSPLHVGLRSAALQFAVNPSAVRSRK